MGLPEKKICVALATAALFAAAPASAQGAFPSKPVTIVAAFPPGGTVDLLARVWGPDGKDISGPSSLTCRTR